MKTNAVLQKYIYIYTFFLSLPKKKKKDTNMKEIRASQILLCPARDDMSVDNCLLVYHAEEAVPYNKFEFGKK